LLQASDLSRSLSMMAAPTGWERLAWHLVLPAAAECTASVWFPEVQLFGVELQLASLNILGAFIEGFFDAFTTVSAQASSLACAGVAGAVASSVAGDMQGYFLSTFTSWAGMVGKAAFFAHEAKSCGVGILYMAVCILLGVVAHTAGGKLAGAFASSAKRAPPSASSTSTLRLAALAAVTAFVVGTYVSVFEDIAAFEDAELIGEQGHRPALLAVFNAAHSRLLVAIAFSIAGAHVGNWLGDAVDGSREDDASSAATGKVTVASGTLVCNLTFALLGLSLNAATVRHARWSHSVLLQSFAGSFCGAASAFNGHATDSRNLLAQKDSTAIVDALKNALANLVPSVLVMLVAYELEVLLAIGSALDANGDDFVAFGEIRAHYRL